MRLDDVAASSNVVDLRGEDFLAPNSKSDYGVLDVVLHANPTVQDHPMLAILMIGGCVALWVFLMYVAFWAGKGGRS
jgi:hypothetical protein